jgi:hypothetical protein
MKDGKRNMAEIESHKHEATYLLVLLLRGYPKATECKVEDNKTNFIRSDFASRSLAMIRETSQAYSQ